MWQRFGWEIEIVCTADGVEGQDAVGLRLLAVAVKRSKWCGGQWRVRRRQR
jgi:hypothetical protein